MKLTTKIWIGFAVPTALLVTLGFGASWGLARVNQKVSTIYDDRVVPLKQLKTISDDYAVLIIDAAHKASEDYITFNEAIADVKKAQDQVDETWGEYRKTSLTQQEAELAREVETLFEEADDMVTQLLNALQNQDEMALERLDGDLYRVIDPVSEKIQELIELQLEVAAQERSEAATTYERTLWILWSVVGLFVFIILVPARFLINRTITNTFSETVNSLVSAASEIAAASEQQEQTANQQATSVNETTTTMDELEASSRQSTEQAESAASAAQSALALADDGNKSVESAMREMNQLKQKVNAISQQILNLSEQTNQIGSISQLVFDISNQTNMLALNASVEAVRAGEHGKGFAVVAGEIRKLADQSKQSAENISGLVGDIQKSIDATVMVTDEGTKTVEASVNNARSTAQVFEKMTESINNVVTNNQQILLNLKQQATATEQVVAAMTTLSQGAKETASSISQTKIGTEKLNETASGLQAMV